jgi:hypothetical protein
MSEDYISKKTDLSKAQQALSGFNGILMSFKGIKYVGCALLSSIVIRV